VMSLQGYNVLQIIVGSAGTAPKQSTSVNLQIMKPPFLPALVGAKERKSVALYDHVSSSAVTGTT
jgi:hypothetical protein